MEKSYQPDIVVVGLQEMIEPNILTNNIFMKVGSKLIGEQSNKTEEWTKILTKALNHAN